jgi:hypothetical protein
MNFGAIKSKAIAYIGDRTDMDDIIGDFVNAALRALELIHQWKHMETLYTGTLSGDSVSVPALFKDIVYFKITDGNEQKTLGQKAYSAMIDDYPGGSSSPDVPEVFAYQKASSVFYVRPYPSSSFSYELLTRNFSADLSNDTDTNYFTDNAWSALVLGTLLEAADAAYEIDDTRIARWQAGYNRHVDMLIAADILGDVTGSKKQVKPTTFVT